MTRTHEKVCYPQQIPVTVNNAQFLYDITQQLLTNTSLFLMLDQTRKLHTTEIVGVIYWEISVFIRVHPCLAMTQESECTLSRERY